MLFLFSFVALLLVAVGDTRACESSAVSYRCIMSRSRLSKFSFGRAVFENRS